MHSVAFVASARLTSNTPHSAGPQLRIRRGRSLRRCRRTVRLNILQAAAYNRHAFALRWLRSRARQKTMCGEYVSMRVCECVQGCLCGCQGARNLHTSTHSHPHTHPHSQREPNPLHYPRVLVFSIPRMALAISSVAVSAGLAAKRLHGSGMRCGMNDLPTGRPTDRPNRPTGRPSERPRLNEYLPGPQSSRARQRVWRPLRPKCF